LNDDPGALSEIKITLLLKGKSMNQRICMFWATCITALCVAPTQAALIHYTVDLTGAAEAPPNASTATGSADFTYDDSLHTLLIDIVYSGLSAAPTASHVHCCTAVPGVGTASVATVTPTFPGFPTTISGTYTQLFDLTLASSFRAGYITANGGTPASAEAALARGIHAGGAYLNIHTSNFPGGEIRGFLTQVPVPAPVVLLGLGLALGFASARRR
jgi:hypothetical protein